MFIGCYGNVAASNGGVSIGDFINISTCENTVIDFPCDNQNDDVMRQSKSSAVREGEGCWRVMTICSIVLLLRAFLTNKCVLISRPTEGRK